MSKQSPFAIHKALIGIGGEPNSVKRLRSGDLLIETNSALQTKSFYLPNPFLDSPITISPHKTLNSCRGVISESDLLTTPDTEILDGFSDQGVIQCQRFGHSQNSCRGQLTCSRSPKINSPTNVSHTYAQAAKSSNKTSSTQTDEIITKIKCPPLELLQPLSSTIRKHLSIYTPDVSTSSSSTQAQLLPSTSSISTSNSESQPPIPTCTDAPSKNMVTPLESSSSIIPTSSSQSVIPPPSDSNTVQDAKKLAKSTIEEKKKRITEKMKEAIIDI
ncbi:uncharacterized protein TNCV_2245461 [Trichonephila clavipes]|nr:uncharacterized protein TNCV_2245461 [Trichonephila clavipes]